MCEEVGVLYVFGFERTGVAIGDLYLVDPEPEPGQEGAERGVRVEVRLLEQGAPPGSIYSARPVAVTQPVWRADLLESVEGPPGSFDRTHHHPAFTGWEPGRRVYVTEMSDDPLGWLGACLADLDGLLASAGFPAGAAAPGDAESLRAAAPEIVAVTGRLLEKVRSGELGNPPGDESPDVVRAGWL